MTKASIANFIDQKSDTKDIAKAIASYLIDTKQTQSLDSLLRDVMTARESRGLYEITVASSHPLEQKQTNAIKEYFSKNFKGASEVIVHTKIDPTLLGGLRIESANYLIDQTLKSKLNHIKSSIDK